MAATTSTSCASIFNFRGNSVDQESRIRSQSGHSSSPVACTGKVDGVAMWIINGVANAFFASLERCSCIRIATVDDVDDLNDVPLILNDGNIQREGSSCSRRRPMDKGTKNKAPFVDQD